MSDKPKGFPRRDQNLDTLKIDSRLDKKVVTMNWTIDEELAKDLTEFKIFRNSKMVSEIAMNRNAYGLSGNTYNFTDTVSNAGNYSYNIYGVRGSDNIPMLLSQRKFTVEKERAQAKAAVVKILPLRLMFKEHDVFHLRLYNYDGDHLLWKHDGESQGEGELFMIDPRPYVQYGVKKFQLLVLDSDNNQVDVIYFRVGNDGEIIKE
jgi:hypothetical protein